MIRIYFQQLLFYVIGPFLKKLNVENGSKIAQKNWIRKII